MTHVLRTWPEGFNAILDGRKTYEVRKADRPFGVGDELLLQEWIPQKDGIVNLRVRDGARAVYDPEGNVIGGYTGREIRCVVTYMTPGGHFGLPHDLCVMSIGGIRGPQEKDPHVTSVGGLTDDRET